MSNDDITKIFSTYQCCDVKEYLGVNGLMATYMQDLSKEAHFHVDTLKLSTHLIILGYKHNIILAQKIRNK